MKTRTPRPWPEGAEPTPEQLADWLEVCDRTERVEFASSALAALRFVATEAVRR